MTVAKINVHSLHQRIGPKSTFIRYISVLSLNYSDKFEARHVFMYDLVVTEHHNVRQFHSDECDYAGGVINAF